MTERETGKAKAYQTRPLPSEKHAFLARNDMHCTTVELQSQLTTVKSVFKFFSPIFSRSVALSHTHANLSVLSTPFAA